MKAKSRLRTVLNFVPIATAVLACAMIHLNNPFSISTKKDMVKNPDVMSMFGATGDLDFYGNDFGDSI